MPRISAAQAGGTNALAFLDLIAWCEGTDKDVQPSKDQGYDVVAGEVCSDPTLIPRSFPLDDFADTAKGTGIRAPAVIRFWLAHSTLQSRFILGKKQRPFYAAAYRAHSYKARTVAASAGFLLPDRKPPLICLPRAPYDGPYTIGHLRRESSESARNATIPERGSTP